MESEELKLSEAEFVGKLDYQRMEPGEGVPEPMINDGFHRQWNDEPYLTGLVAGILKVFAIGAGLMVIGVGIVWAVKWR